MNGFGFIFATANLINSIRVLKFKKIKLLWQL